MTIFAITFSAINSDVGGSVGVTEKVQIVLTLYRDGLLRIHNSLIASTLTKNNFVVKVMYVL